MNEKVTRLLTLIHKENCEIMKAMIIFACRDDALGDKITKDWEDVYNRIMKE